MDTLYGESGDDAIDGGLGNDLLLDGGTGDDTLNGGPGDDALEGGLDNGTFLVSTAWGHDSLADSGGAADMLRLSDIGADLVFRVDGAGLYVVPASGAGSPGNDLTHAANSIEFVVSGSGDDEVRFLGTATLAAGAGVIYGGAGHNTLSYLGYSSGVTVDLSQHQAQGAASVFDFADVFGSDYDDTLTGDANQNWLVGGRGADRLAGLDGNDRLDGGLDSDPLEGGFGDDLYRFEELATAGEQDTVVEVVGGGRDHLDFSSLSGQQFIMVDLAYTTTTDFGRQFQDGASPSLRRTLKVPGTQLGQPVEIEIVSTGAGNDTIVANGTGNVLAGGAGDDTYKLPDGLVGDVTLKEEVTTYAGAVMVTGGLDTVDFSQFTGGVAFDLSQASQTVNTPGSLVLRLKDLQGADAPLHYENVTGGSGDDTLKGNRLANVIHGGAGSHDLYGGSGNDTYVFVPVGSGVTTHLYESAGTASLGLVTSGGGDTLDFSALTTGVTFDLGDDDQIVVNNRIFLWDDAGQGAPLLFENVIGALSAANVLYGNQNDNVLVGGTQADRSYGQGGADLLIGLAGADALHGDAGRDVLIGGLGADTISGGDGQDILIAGFTTYDAAPTRRDLETIRRAWLWTGEDNDYPSRVDRIMQGIGLGKSDPAFPRPGLRQTLPNQTVFDDNPEVDQLDGEGDLDWFLKNAGDILGPLDSGEKS